MNTWRMSFRCGNQGYEMWPECFKHGVAAISYEPVDDLNLSKYAYGDPPERWAELTPSQKASIRRVAYEMRKGDVIYVKQGPVIVCRGRVVGRYSYKLKRGVVDDDGCCWPHQVPVLWERDFTPIPILLGAEPLTVRKLTDRHLNLLGQSERGTNHAQRLTEAAEGEILRAYMKFRRRNRSLIEAKRVQCSDRMECEVCSFSFRTRYGPTVGDALEVHHCNPMAERKGLRVTTIDELALLCPNCHRAMHTATPVITVGDLRKMLR